MDNQSGRKMRKYLMATMVIAVVTVLTLLGCAAFNFYARGVFALPFWQKPVAIVEVTDRDSAEKRYYTVYANGTKAETADADGRESDEIAHFAGEFTTTKLISAKNTEGGTIYCTDDGECYEELPVVDDADLLAISGDFSEKISGLRLTSLKYFRDGGMIYVSGLRDTGFGGSNRKVYAYNIAKRRLQFLISFSANEDVDSVYAYFRD